MTSWGSSPGHGWQLKKATSLMFPVQLAVGWASYCLYKPWGGASSVLQILEASRALSGLLPGYWEPHFRKEHPKLEEITTEQTPILEAPMSFKNFSSGVPYYTKNTARSRKINGRVCIIANPEHVAAPTSETPF